MHFQLLAAEGGSTLDNQECFGFLCQENGIKTTFTRMGRVVNLDPVQEETISFQPSVSDVINPNVIDPGSDAASSMSTEPMATSSIDRSNLIPRRAAPNGVAVSSTSPPPLQRLESVEPGEIVPSSDPRSGH